MCGIQQYGLFTSFYRGRLAGLSTKERLREQKTSVRWRDGRILSFAEQNKVCDEDAYWMYGYDNHSYERFTTSVEAGSSLEECLMGSTCDQLKNALHRMGVTFPSTVRKADLVKTVADELPHSWKCMEKLLSKESVATIEMLSEAANTEVVTVDASRIEALRSEGYGFPYLFWPKKGENDTAFVPQELRQMLLSSEFTTLAQRRKEVLSIQHILYGAAVICGAVNLEDAYAFYSSSDETPFFLRSEFGVAAKQICRESPCLELCRIDDKDVVLCHPRVCDVHPEGITYRRMVTNTFSYDSPRFLPEYLKQRVDVVPRPFTDCLTSCDAASYIYNLPSVVELTEYFDCHVPRYTEETTFADAMVDGLIGMILFERNSLGEVFARLTKQGWFLAEGSNMAPRLTALVCNLYRSLPRWELNGWSEQEYGDMLGSTDIIADDYPYECDYRLAS